ncbi:hypothetical protein T10_12299 [Trichinella papuae]|uniref:Uncharacterized protein n=1 Tax=Trichinella papuae TaxID=268474 RepID=A0A0V1M4U5_9BILA|nr:hypothetical protein T10_12299 [Trichinella papuae]
MPRRYTISTATVNREECHLLMSNIQHNSLNGEESILVNSAIGQLFVAIEANGKATVYYAKKPLLALIGNLRLTYALIIQR